MQGRSLLPILSGQASPDHHRDFVRCEYYDALDQPDGTFGTMYFDGRYKLSVYHGHNLGELYDLAEDPHEFDNLWDDPDFQTLKLDLILRSFDASMLALDVGIRADRTDVGVTCDSYDLIDPVGFARHGDRG